ncbi:zinc knuckle CX2CX4HX4C containing protein, partial [Tanacetum coccineum]
SKGRTVADSITERLTRPTAYKFKTDCSIIPVWCSIHTVIIDPHGIRGTMTGVDVDTLTMEQNLALSRENQAPGVVKPEIGGNVNFEIKSQFMSELREDTFSGNKNEDAHDHIDRAFIQRYYPPSMTVKKLEEIHNFKQVGDESLYQAWERNIESSSSNDGLAALVNKLDNLGRDMKKLKESVHAIQVGCQICEGPHLDKDCPLSEEVKKFEEVRYGEFGRTTPFNGNNRGKFRVGPSGYYTKTDNYPPYGERRQCLEELLTKHQEESARRSTEMDGSSSAQIKIVTSDHETSGLNKLHGVSFISGPESDIPKVLQHQLPPKELNLGSFTLPYTIGKFNFYAMANLGASINVMPRSIFEHLHPTNLKKTNVLCEMANMSKKAPLGIVENIIVKIDKFLFPSDFAIIDNTPSETTILGRPFLATIHAEIDVFAGKFSLGINEDRISFDSMRKDNNPSEKIFMVNSGLINRPQSPAQSNNQIDYEESGNWDNRSPNLGDRKNKKRKINLDENVPRAHFCNLIK